MLLLEAEHLASLAIGERRFVSDHRPGHWHARHRFARNSAVEKIGSYSVVDSVENLEAEPVLLQAEMHDLAEIARINVIPGIALS